MDLRRLLVAAVAVLTAACSSGAGGFDRANDEFEATVHGLELTDGESFDLGFHPTEATATIHAGGVRGPLLLCPVDGTGALWPDPTIGVPPCEEVGEVAALEPTDGLSHVRAGFRSLGEAAAESLTLRYRQADGYFALFYVGEPRTVTIVGPDGARPIVTNFGETATTIDGVELEPGEVIEVSGSSLVVDLGVAVSLDIDWFRERPQAEGG